jgi:sarcosine oxidase, subunit alpha
MISEPSLLIIGGGPAGLAAASIAIDYNIDTVLIDDAFALGGQLVKQTHKFFGSEMEYAGVRGINIPQIFLDKLGNSPHFKSYARTSAIGYYDDGVVTALKEESELLKFKPKEIIVATGAREKMIPFKGNDLPGVYGAGAIQTLMNVHGVVPGKNVLMVGAGNIGLIVSYQLLQAGVSVTAIVEALPYIGGYWVHASKIRRLGVPILTEHTIIEAHGYDRLVGATIAKIGNSHFEQCLEVDTICLAVGLLPLSDFFRQAQCEMKYVRELGGDVPIRNRFMQTTKKNIFVAGDAGGIEEASSAIIGGYIAGLAAAHCLNADIQDFDEKVNLLYNELGNLRSGVVGTHIREGMQIVCTV